MLSVDFFMKKIRKKYVNIRRLVIPIMLSCMLLTVNIFAQENRAIFHSVSDGYFSISKPAFNISSITSIKPTPSANVIQAETTDTRTWTKFKYKDLIADTSHKYDLDPQLIYATIMTESEGNEYAYRFEPHLDEPSLCMGQILVSTARGLGFEDDPIEMFEPKICIDLIGKYHRNMLDTYNSLTPQQLARAYNTGSPWKRPVYGHLARFNMWYHEES